MSLRYLTHLLGLGRINKCFRSKQYCKILLLVENFQVVRDSAELIEEKETLRQIELSNFNKLQSELDAFISLIDDVITDEHIEALQNANLSDPVG